MTELLEQYGSIAGEQVISSLYRFANFLQGKKVVHVNSTRKGGGVAEILRCMVPLLNELGIETRWEVIEGSESFFVATKSIHNALQGLEVPFPESYREIYIETNRENAEKMRDRLEDADFVFIHDPQPAPLLSLCPKRRGKWIWRCHIDASSPNRNVWKMLRHIVSSYDASVFSLADFSQHLPHSQYLIPPSIDPLSEKNIILSEREVDDVCQRFGINRARPLIVQISRFDLFKDPLGVIKGYQMAKQHADMQLVLAGGGATDDPEAGAVLEQVRNVASDDSDIHVIELPSDAHRVINALQAAADVIIQKSIREGFGLTVAEGMWKYKPVIGGDVGGIRLQIINRYNGFRVQSAEGAALRLRYLLAHGRRCKRMGQNAHEYVQENFLITTHLRALLALMLCLSQDSSNDFEMCMTS
ncbi:MAG: glycosyltransferase [Aminobacterium sp.]|jgi:trehalose synthase|nr:glycosyltransferase [Aminobacterium sp.]MDD2206602.1 glycosyltransferase [Aminobacterium sp.]MDD3425485.1 glycosyltransferase [Aminobacterium sp.]MDD3706834.1 glycosyltransferase [Aminobacterium sp.]MDD4228651.1 glycosyltransferase [Aminobacterium sp.]MDD4551579.1 glycosyltransferase [Aminobacterium sp.]